MDGWMGDGEGRGGGDICTMLAVCVEERGGEGEMNVGLRSCAAV